MAAQLISYCERWHTASLPQTWNNIRAHIQNPKFKNFNAPMSKTFKCRHISSKKFCPQPYVICYNEKRHIIVLHIHRVIYKLLDKKQMNFLFQFRTYSPNTLLSTWKHRQIKAYKIVLVKIYFKCDILNYIILM